MPDKSYAAATSAHAPDPATAPHPSLALLDGAQPANRDALLQRHPHALDQLDEAGFHIELPPHRPQGSGAERGNGQNESKASRSDGDERAHSNRHRQEPNGRQSGKHFASTISGHPAMEGKQSPADIGGDLVEPCEPLPLCAASRTDPFRLPADPRACTGIPRANIAASADKPDGTQEGGWAKSHDRQSVLQQHCAWWDPVSRLLLRA